MSSSFLMAWRIGKLGQNYARKHYFWHPKQQMHDLETKNEYFFVAWGLASQLAVLYHPLHPPWKAELYSIGKRKFFWVFI
jgi:hypothetical protein